ncbi:MAG: ATP-grasp domain-containing protein [Candidatus Omnitrophica bacterium]|nr:ATP-grasp domain-containing protein [Candidatus Omnitrophota bacterium]
MTRLKKPPAKSARAKKIGLTYNLKKPGALADEYEEFDELDTILAIKKEFEGLGSKVLLFEQDEALASRLAAGRPDLVFNIAEGFGATRGRESQVPCILESLGIPYSGSDPVVLGVTLDKYYTSVFLRAHGIPVPQMYMVKSEAELRRVRSIFSGGKKFIVKPRWEGSSKGIFLKSVVNNCKDLRKRATEVMDAYRQPAVVEEFLAGEEITAGVCGNDDLEVLGMMRISPVDIPTKDFLYSIETKRDWRKKVRYDKEALISLRTKKAVGTYAAAAFKALELRDFSRVDFRLDGEGTPRIIDINPLPGLSPAYSDLPILYRLKGGTYSGLIRKILTAVLSRNGFEL